MKNINSVHEYLDEVYKIYEEWNGKKHMLFRRHSDSMYKLVPTVLRNATLNENEILLDYKQYAPFHQIKYDFKKEIDKVLVDMQHHEIPTRLLDWTLAPLNALFFACCNNHKKNGQVVVLNPWSYWNEIVKDKSHVEIHHIHILSRALLAKGWQVDIVFEYIKREFNYHNLKVEDIKAPFPFVASFTNARILHQRGCFTIHGLCATELDGFRESNGKLKTINIDCNQKEKIISELNKLYINDYSIYPDFKVMSDLIKRKGGLFNL